MFAKRVTPILNVSNLEQSFAWFEKLGWTKAWEWGDPPDFGGVRSGEQEVFLCVDAQGGRSPSGAPAPVGFDGAEATHQGSWMMIWIDDVDAVHRDCLAQGLQVTLPPTTMPWNVREMHLRHPDGHVFRIAQGLEEE